MEPIDRVVVERGAVGLAATACVRFRDVAGDVVGSGFLVGPDLVATCAHVVAAAAGADPYADSPPDAPVRLDFPMVTSDVTGRSASVRRWVPIGEDGTGDVALLRLDRPAPPGAVMPPLRRVDGLWDHPIRTFGFPVGREDGVWTTGRTRAAQGTGWLQLQGTPGDQPIEGGYSGAPVWDDESEAVVGMAVAADRDPGVTTAYLIPVERVLGLDPELLPNPYRGMEPFDEEHAEFFFGRDPELARLRELLAQFPLVAVAGPSGAGKSSLVKAGLLARLRAQDARIGQLRPRPDVPVLPKLVAEVLRLADPDSAPGRRARDAARIAGALSARSRAGAVRELADAVAECRGRRLVLYLDQFEELADTAPEAARELLAVLIELAVAVGAGSGLRMVLTVRGVAVDQAMTPALAGALAPVTVFVGPLDRGRLREVIIRPAERAPGLAFEDGLVDRILDDAGAEPGQLPLVESLLARLWERRTGGSVTNEAYRAVGGVAGALAGQAERVVAAVLGVGGSERRLRALCTRMAAPSHEGGFVRRPVRYTDLPADLRELVPPLVAGRILVVSGGRGAHRAASTLELAHQALVEHWPRLRAWLGADRAFLTWHAELDRDRRRWLATDRDDGALLRGANLGAADRWVADRPADLTADELDYLRRSRARRTSEGRRRRVIGAALAVLVVVAGILVAVAVRGGHQISAQQASATAETLGKEAVARQSSDPLLAAELAVAGWRSDPASATARSGLAGSYLGLAGTDRVLAGAPGGAPILRIRSEAGVVAFLSQDGTKASFVIDAGGERPRYWELSVPGGIGGGELSPDGHYYQALTRDGAMRLWTIGSDTPPVELVAPGGPRVHPVSFAPGTTRLGWVTETPAGGATLTVYDTATHTSATRDITLPEDISSGLLTSDPNVMLIRRAGANQNVLYPITPGVAARDLPPNTRVGVAGGAEYALTCGPDDKPGLAPVFAFTVTGLEDPTHPRRLPLAGSGCDTTWVSNDGGYLLERILQPKGVPRPAQQQDVWRATAIDSGRAYQFATPPIDTSVRTQKNPEGLIAMTRGTDGAPVALVAAGPELLRVRTVPEEPTDPTAESVSRSVTADGRTMVTLENNRVESYDTVTGQRLGALAEPLSPRGAVRMADGPWVTDRGPDGWTLTRYDVPGLTPRFRINLPSPAGAPVDKGGVNFALGARSTGEPTTVATLVDGILSAWDATTGAPLGAPVDLAKTPAQRDWFRDRAGLWPRVGHPEQMIVGTGDHELQLWDVPAGRMLRTLPVAYRGRTAVAAAGDHLAVETITGSTTDGQAGGLDVWNLATGERTATGLPLPGAPDVMGVDADGYLVVANELKPLEQRISFYDLDRGVEAGTVVPGSMGVVRVVNGRLVIDGIQIFAPLNLAGTAAQWRDQLCRLLPPQPSAPARGLIPAAAPPPCPP